MRLITILFIVLCLTLVFSKEQTDRRFNKITHHAKKASTTGQHH